MEGRQLLRARTILLVRLKAATTTRQLLTRFLILIHTEDGQSKKSSGILDAIAPGLCADAVAKLGGQSHLQVGRIGLRRQ